MKVCSISYLNSIPFVYGLENSDIGVDLSLEIPSVCGQKLIKNEVDLALLPVAVIPSLDFADVVSPYCISSDGAVQTVCLFSQVPLEQIKTILLDYHSITSNALVKLLSKYFWKIQPDFKKSEINFESKISGNTAGVIIGDRAYKYRDDFPFIYDLSYEWKKFCGLHCACDDPSSKWPRKQTCSPSLGGLREWLTNLKRSDTSLQPSRKTLYNSNYFRDTNNSF